MIEDFRLSPNFWFYELTGSADHPELVEQNREIALNDPEIMANLELMTEEYLEVIRSIHHEAMYGLSGFRSDDLNTAVGGADASQHKLAMATDFTMDDTEMLEYIFSLVEGGNFPVLFHQIIYYPDRKFIHFGMPTGVNDGQFWIQR